VIDTPITPGDDAYRRCHNAWLITTTWSRPGLSSPGKKVRPD